MTDTTDLPPLPEPEGAMTVDVGPLMRRGQEIGRIEECADAYSEAQMQAYARLAVEQERERALAEVKKVSDWLDGVGGDPFGWAVEGKLDELAAAIKGGFVNIGDRTVSEIKHPVSAEDFGIPKELAQKAQYFADFLVIQERERCAQLCASVAWQAVDLADAIRGMKK